MKILNTEKQENCYVTNTAIPLYALALRASERG